MNKWAVAGIVISLSRLGGGLLTWKVLQPVVKLVVQYVSLKLVEPVPLNAPLKKSERSVIAPASAVTSKVTVASCDWPDPTVKPGLKEKPSFPRTSIGVMAVFPGVGSVAPPVSVGFSKLK